MKKKGSLIIEVVVSLWIVMIIILISTNICVELVSNIEEREREEYINRVFYCIKSDIRYGNDFERIKEKLDEKYIVEFQDDIINSLKKNSILDISDLNGGNKIILSVIYIENNELLIEITLLYKGIEYKEYVSKSKWMDEL